jgi:hypothetical protein
LEPRAHHQTQSNTIKNNNHNKIINNHLNKIHELELSLLEENKKNNNLLKSIKEKDS